MNIVKSLDKKYLIIFDKKNNINYSYFSLKRLKDKIKKKVKIKISFNKRDIKNFQNIFLVGFISKIKLQKNKNYFTVHESALPKDRGFSPLKWQIMKKKTNFTSTLFKLNDKLDSGEITFQENFKIKKTDMFDEIKLKQMIVTENLISRFINKHKNVKLHKQKGRSNYLPKLTELQDKIDPRKALIDQFDIIRSTNPSYKNYFIINGIKFQIKIKKI
tara:strand:- start:123 stop:773 length:651 start_codon:yes stop_codon:yes gene_type:complete